MFPYCDIHKYTWTFLQRKTHNQIDHVLVDWRLHSSVLDVQSFRGADCDADHCLVVAKVRERLAVGKRSVNKMDKDRFNIKKLNDGDVKEQYQVTIKNKFATLENLMGHQWGMGHLERTSNFRPERVSVVVNRKPLFDEECYKLVDRRKQVNDSGCRSK
jgi:hypothetical protein